jgi:aldehyde:ferredoxin oxidoreductase
MHGKALVVDLTAKTSQEQEVPQKYYDQYIGGRGLGGRLLHDFMDPKADPLGPENVLMFVSGPLNATRAFYSSKSVVVTKSPQSGTCLYTISSGGFCHNLSKCGYDVLIIKGKSAQPVYLGSTARSKSRTHPCLNEHRRRRLFHPEEVPAKAPSR